MDIIDKVLQEKYYYKQTTGLEPKFLVLDTEKYLSIRTQLSDRHYSETNREDNEELFGLILVVTKKPILEVTS